jgi:DNA mismatch repair protein MutS
VHVAELAGLPRAVVQRAREVLLELERGANGRNGKRAEAPQLALLAPEPAGDPLRGEIAALDVDGMSPLDALNRLYELRERARDGGGRSGA